MSKVLFVTMEFWPFLGGVARYYKNFCDAWGSDLFVYTQLETQNSKFKIQNLEDERYEIIRKPFFWKFIWPHWSKLLVDLFFYIRAHEPSVIFVGQILPVGTAAYLLQQIFHFDYVVFVHGLDILWAARGNRLKRWLTQRILRNSCLVIANSEYTKRITEELFGVMDEKTVVVSPKAYESENSQQGAVNREQPPLLDNLGGLPLVLSGGRFVVRKGFDDVIEVAKHFVGKAVFAIFGRGPDEERLRTLIHQHQLEDTVLLETRNLNDEELSVLYDSCAIFVFLPKELPGGDVEGFGQVVLEAQSHGKPVIVRNSGGAGEALVPGETGFLWDGMDQGQLHQYINILIYDGEKRRLMGERGREFARMMSEKFDQSVVRMKNALVGQEKKVSVMIPVGYGLDRLGPTLESLARQTYKNIEVIVVGDGIPIELPTTHYQLLTTVLSISKGGAAAARNAGARKATGEYLLFVDDDTRLREDCIEKMIRRLQLRNIGRHLELDLGSINENQKQTELSSSSIIGDPDSKNKKEKDLNSFDVSFDFLDSLPVRQAGRFRGNDKGEVDFVYSGFKLGWKAMPAVPFDRKTVYQYPYIDTTSMIRREAFPGFSARGGPAFGWDESLKRLQDWDLFLTIVDKGGQGEAINEYLYRKSTRLFKNLLKWKGISFWFPKFIWKLPFIKQLSNHLPPVKQYHEAVMIVKRRHNV